MLKPCKACGAKPILVKTPFPFVECVSSDCWSGPACKTKEKAEYEWNRLMGETEDNRNVVASMFEHGVTTVICDDGSVFCTSDISNGWSPQKPIPGTKADKKHA